MFESVAPETFVPAQPEALLREPADVDRRPCRRRPWLILGGTTWNVKFPIDSPRLHMAYSIEMEPTHAASPPSRAASRRSRSRSRLPEDRPAPPPDEIVAPTIIPDEIPDVEPIAAVEDSVGDGTGGEAVVKGLEQRGRTARAPKAPRCAAGVPGGVEGGIGEGSRRTPWSCNAISSCRRR